MFSPRQDTLMALDMLYTVVFVERSYNYFLVKESKHLLQGSSRKPADILLPFWTGGKDTAWDVTVVHPLQFSMVARAATTPGHGAQEAYARKWRGAGEQCLSEGIVFVPLALESLGGWHEAAVREVKKLGGALARRRRVQLSGTSSRGGVSSW